MPDYLSADEIRLAVRILRLTINVDAGDTLTPSQLAAWVLVRDCYIGNLSDHCSRVSDRAQVVERPVVQTKRTVARWRE